MPMRKKFAPPATNRTFDKTCRHKFIAVSANGKNRDIIKKPTEKVSHFCGTPARIEMEKLKKQHKGT